MNTRNEYGLDAEQLTMSLHDIFEANDATASTTGLREAGYEPISAFFASSEGRQITGAAAISAIRTRAGREYDDGIIAPNVIPAGESTTAIIGLAIWVPVRK